jgi:hypothetical protein
MIWSHNNLVFSGLTIITAAACKALSVPNAIFIVAICSGFIGNSVIDLWNASKFYILYESNEE